MARFDKEGFALVVHTRRFMAEQKLQGFANSCGVSKSCVFRVENKQAVSIENFLKICRFLGEQPMTFLVWEGCNGKVSRGTDGETEAQK